MLSRLAKRTIAPRNNRIGAVLCSIAACLRINEAIAQLKKAVSIQDSLSYIEPPSWYYPVRHNLGYTLLKAGQVQEAEAVYREDLKQYPHNGWSLLGLMQSLQAQGKTKEAQTVQQQFTAAWKYADVKLTASQF